MQLISGLTITKPEQILEGYLKTVYPRYDSHPVERNNSLSLNDIIVSRGLVSRVSDIQARAIVALGPQVSRYLAFIPSRVDLLDVDSGAPIPGSEGLSSLINSMCRIPGVKLAKTMKILHRKRPTLLPIFDSVVEWLYWPRLKADFGNSTWGEYALSLMRMFHQDMLSVEDDLRSLRRHTEKLGTPLSHCRILDLLIWVERTGNANYFRLKARPD